MQRMDKSWGNRPLIIHSSVCLFQWLETVWQMTCVALPRDFNRHIATLRQNMCTHMCRLFWLTEVNHITMSGCLHWPGVLIRHHDDVIKWEHFPRYWPFVRGIHRSPVNSPSQRPVTRSFDAFFDLRLNKRLGKQSWRRWFEMPLRSLWRHRNDGLRFLHHAHWKLGVVMGPILSSLMTL